MKRIVLLIFTCLAFTVVQAQDSALVGNTEVIRFAYLSYEKVLHALPDYSIVQQQLDELRTQYENELKRAEQDFNLKYEEFLEGQRDFPESILRKRQTELKELLERNIAFKAESRQQLAQAEAELMEPLRLRLADALERIGMERGYAFILNTDANAVPFINPAQGEDVSEAVILLMK